MIKNSIKLIFNFLAFISFITLNLLNLFIFKRLFIYLRLNEQNINLYPILIDRSLYYW